MTINKTNFQTKRFQKTIVELMEYRKVASSNTSRLEAHAGFFRLIMNGIFDPYVLDLLTKVDFLISNAR